MVDLFGAASILSVVFIFMTLFRVGSLERRVAALSSLNHKIDALLKHAGIEYDPYGELSEAVIQAIKRGEKIEAIKHYRAATGVGLKEAKESIEEIQRRAGLGTW